MAQIPAIELEAKSSSLSAPKAPSVRPLLEGVACCRNLPAKEGIGPQIEKEIPEGFLLDDRFLIREVIGRSKMSTIYRAEDSRNGGRPVAVKVPLMSVESDPLSFGRFLREERIGASLKHPCLLQFITVAEKKSRPYIVMEYLDGCTLACVLHLTKPLPEKDSLRIASAICQALKHMHDKGIVHRDLKPGNVMLCRNQTLCLMDLGLAAEISAKGGLLASMTPIFGTPEYMAPEQVRNQRNDERTDVYSVGVILYQMLTGVLPFESEDVWKAAQMRTSGDPVAPRKINPAISPQAEEIVLRALRRKPADRFPDVAAFRAALDAPERVEVTGLSEGLQPQRFRLSLEGTPFLTGALIGVGTLVSLVTFFYLFIHFSKGGR
jgi:serine/threonine-protein kinase